MYFECANVFRFTFVLFSRKQDLEMLSGESGSPARMLCANAATKCEVFFQHEYATAENIQFEKTHWLY